MKHIQGQCRHQATLFAEVLDDLIAPNHAVRVVDAFVDQLDLALLGFSKVQPAATGRPPYHPGALLKLYVYGYMNQVRSSRRLEKESHRNVELLWLLDGLHPDFKSIANFRRAHRKALVGVCRSFVHFCRSQSLFGSELVAVDGSKFQAASGKKSVYTRQRVERELSQVEGRIAAYLAELDESDASEERGVEKVGEVSAALEVLSQRSEELQALAEDLRENKVTHRVCGEADARLMRQAGGGREVSYNVQTAVDSKHKLIAVHEVTTASNDRNQLYPMARMAQSALGVEKLTVVADAGYQNARHAQACEAAGVTAAVPRHRTVNPKGNYFDRSDFTYDAAGDRYRCPAGKSMKVSKVDKQRQIRYYTSSACASCSLKPRCTVGSHRTINRRFGEDAAQRMHHRTVEHPDWMRQRASLSEHPFGNLKRMMGSGQFLMRGLENVKGEMGLSVLAYNLKRVTNIMGVEALCARLAVGAS